MQFEKGYQIPIQLNKHKDIKSFGVIIESYLLTYLITSLASQLFKFIF